MDALNADLTIGRKYSDTWLLVNETPFEELPKFEEKVTIPEIAHSTVDEFNGSSVQLITFNLFLKGHLKPVSVEHNMRGGFATLDFAGKPMKTWKVKNFKDAFKVPYNFTAEGKKFTLRMGFDSEGNETDTLELDIEGLHFKQHPYLDINFGKNSSLT